MLPVSFLSCHLRKNILLYCLLAKKHLCNQLVIGDLERPLWLLWTILDSKRQKSCPILEWSVVLSSWRVNFARLKVRSSTTWVFAHYMYSVADASFERGIWDQSISAAFPSMIMHVWFSSAIFGRGSTDFTDWLVTFTCSFISSGLYILPVSSLQNWFILTFGTLWL